LAVIVVVNERLDERSRKNVDLDGWHETTAMDLPEIGQWEVLSPEGPPTIDGASVYAEEFGKLAYSPGRGPLPHRGDQDDDCAEVNFSPEEAYGWGRDSFAAAVAPTAEAEPKAIGRRQIIGSPWLSRVVSAVQSLAATRAGFLSSAIGNSLVDGKKKRPEAGVARQTMYHRGVLRVR